MWQVMWRKKIILCLLIGSFFLPFGQTDLKAMDPVTIAILAPVAIKAAKVMMPYVLQALKNAGGQMIKIGLDLAGILKLPLGLVQSTVGAPIGMFSSGVKNIMDGLLAPVQLVWHTVTLPIALFGYST